MKNTGLILDTFKPNGRSRRKRNHPVRDEIEQVNGDKRAKHQHCVSKTLDGRLSIASTTLVLLNTCYVPGCVLVVC